MTTGGPTEPDAYQRAGVDVDRKAQLNADLARRSAAAGTALLAGIGAFAGVIKMPQLKQPVLGATTDSIGTKLKIAIALDRHESTARDILHHCVNDLLCSGLMPLAFLDYIGTHRIDPPVVRRIVDALREECTQLGCSLLGGETAEMPDVYAAGDYDLAGTLIGVGEQDELFNRAHVSSGDILLGLPAAGLHTNGYTLARKLISPGEWHTFSPRCGMTFGDALLAEHRCYLNDVVRLRVAVDVAGLAHITGGGLVDNVPRCLPEGLAAHIDATTLVLPPLLTELRERGHLTDTELTRSFNGGVGMVVVVRPGDVQAAQRTCPETSPIGTVVARDGGSQIQIEGAIR